jgi:hypothetical protein
MATPPPADAGLCDDLNLLREKTRSRSQPARAIGHGGTVLSDDQIAFLDQPMMELIGGVEAGAPAFGAEALVRFGTGGGLLELELEGAADVAAILPALVVEVTRY